MSSVAYLLLFKILFLPNPKDISIKMKNAKYESQEGNIQLGIEANMKRKVFANFRHKLPTHRRGFPRRDLFHFSGRASPQAGQCEQFEKRAHWRELQHLPDLPGDAQ